MKKIIKYAFFYQQIAYFYLLYIHGNRVGYELGQATQAHVQLVPIVADSLQSSRYPAHIYRVSKSALLFLNLGVKYVSQTASIQFFENSRQMTINQFFIRFYIIFLVFITLGCQEYKLLEPMQPGSFFLVKAIV